MRAEPMTLYRIDVHYACFAVEVFNGIVISAAPIGNWMVCKTIEEVIFWVKSKGGEIERFDFEFVDPLKEPNEANHRP